MFEQESSRPRRHADWGTSLLRYAFIKIYLSERARKSERVGGREREREDSFGQQRCATRGFHCHVITSDSDLQSQPPPRPRCRPQSSEQHSIFMTANTEQPIINMLINATPLLFFTRALPALLVEKVDLNLEVELKSKLVKYVCCG